MGRSSGRNGRRCDAAVFPYSAASAQVALVAGCPKPGSISYFDTAKWSRDANAELLRSLHTGKPVNWVKVYCGALRELAHPSATPHSKRHHVTPRHAKTEHHPRRAVQHSARLDHGGRRALPAAVLPAPSPKKTPRRRPSKIPVVTASATSSSDRLANSPAADLTKPAAITPRGKASRSDDARRSSAVVIAEIPHLS